MAVRVVDDDIAKVRLLAGLCFDDLYIFLIRMLYLSFLQLIYYLTSIFTLILCLTVQHFGCVLRLIA